MAVQIGDEVIWSAISAILVGLTLKSSEYFMSRRANEDDLANEKIKNYHESVEDELIALREENRKLREEADKYRELYHALLEKHSA